MEVHQNSSKRRKIPFNRKSDFNVVRSEELNEILTSMPNWMIRWGISFIFLIFILAILLSAFISYPDVITSQVVIETNQPPVKIINKKEGRIKFLVKNNEYVKASSSLALIENPAKLVDIIKLKNDILVGNEPLPQEELSLGELQSTKNLYNASFSRFRLDKELKELVRRKKNILERISEYRTLINQIELEKRVLIEEYKIAKNSYETHYELYKANVTPKLELEQKRSVLLKSERQLNSLEAKKTLNRIQISNLKDQLSQIEITTIRKSTNQINEIEAHKKKLLLEIDNWFENYVMISPIEGYIAFTNYWKNGQYVKSNTEVCTIIPCDQKLVGRIRMPIKGSGKVKVGQRVIIRLENYPYSDFGTIEGRVDEISKVTSDDFYIVIASLTNGLITNLNKTLEFQHGMKGSADIITEDLSFLDRVLGKIKSIIYD